MKHSEPETPPDLVNAEEPELAHFRRRTEELLNENQRLASEILCGKAEVVAGKMRIKSLLETEVRLLTALIADNDALKVYREQALVNANRRIAECDNTKDSKSMWRAFRWEPLSTNAKGEGAWQFDASMSADKE